MNFYQLTSRIVLFWICLSVIMTQGMETNVLMAMSKQPRKENMKHIKTVKGIEEYLLSSNGLRVLLRQDHAAPVVAVMVSYEVGSRDEAENETGAAHLLEHMMFKGTDEYHRSKATAAAQLLEGAGAVLNANTGYDATHYYEMLPSDKLELALDIEASRMMSALLDEKDFEAERQVVLNELERYFDNPTIDIITKIWQNAYQSHPYHHPIIGWRKDVQTMPVDAVRKLYERFYHPQNATLTICGDFDKEQVLGLIEEKFGSLKAPSGWQKREVFHENEQTEARYVDIKREKGSPYVVVSHKMPEALHPDSIKLDLLSAILTKGKTSRLFQKMVHSGLAARVDSGSSGTRDAGLFSTYVTLTDQLSHEQAEEMVLEAYRDIAENGVTAQELQRALNQLEAEIAFARDGVFSMVSELSHAIAFGDWQQFVNYVDLAEKVTVDDLKETAARYFQNDQMTVGRIYIGEKRAAQTGAADSAAGFTHVKPNDGPLSLAQELPEKIKKLIEGDNRSKDAVSYADTAQLIEDENLTLILYPTESENILSIAGSFDAAGTSYHENPMIPAFTALMLDKGTERHTKIELAELLEDRGAQLHFASDYEHVRFNAKCLKKDTDIILDLIFEQLMMPIFDAQELEKAKARHRVAIEQAMASTSASGMNHLSMRMFNEGHPHHNIPLEQQLELLDQVSVESVKQFYGQYYGKQNLMISVAGDFDAALIEDRVRALSQTWKKQKDLIPYPEQAGFAAAGQREHVQVPGVVNFDVFMGHPIPINRLHPDYMSLYVANYILGGDFSARLSSTVRDQYGYTYGIRSGIMGVSESLTGAWVVHLIVNPPLLDKAIEQTKIELGQFAEAGITEKELENAKITIAGKFQVGLATVDALSANLLQVAERGMGIGYLDRFPEEVKALEYAQVNDLIRRYYKPDQLLIVTAGDQSNTPS